MVDLKGRVARKRRYQTLFSQRAVMRVDLADE